MRSILFWWLLSAMSREWWARLLDRYGSPLLIGTFSDNESKHLLERAFSLATRLGGIVCSRETTIEIQKVSSSDSDDAYENFMAICQRERSKLIIGQTLSGEAQSTGLGSGVSDLQSAVREDIRKFDSTMLSDTLIHQLISQFCEINNLPGRVPKIVWGSQSCEEIRATGTLLQSLAQANLELADDGVSKLAENLGLSIQRRNQSSVPSPFSVSPEGGIVPAIRRGINPFSRLVLESSSREDAIQKISKAYPALDRVPILSLIDDVTRGR